MKRVLISSAWLNPARSYDLAIWKKRRNPFAVNAPMTEHFGLRFLKANHPESQFWNIQRESNSSKPSISNGTS